MQIVTVFLLVSMQAGTLKFSTILIFYLSKFLENTLLSFLEKLINQKIMSFWGSNIGIAISRQWVDQKSWNLSEIDRMNQRYLG